MLQKRTEAQFRERLEQANHDLAEAAAADRGWDRETLEAAARRVYAEQRGAEPAELLLVEVLDRPGTDEDHAVFRVEGEGRHRDAHARPPRRRVGAREPGVAPRRRTSTCGRVGVAARAADPQSRVARAGSRA